MSDNREEHCWRIGGPVYMRTDKPCPECGTPDTHTPKSELRAKIEELHEAIEFLNYTISDKQNCIDKALGLLPPHPDVGIERHFAAVRAALEGKDQ